MKTTRRGWCRFAGLLALSPVMGLTGGCQPQGVVFQNVDITGANYGRVLSLNDTQGRKVTLSDYRGKIVALFFGFTHCPDVCPTALSEWAAVKQQLGAQGTELQVLFVTLDPERDSADLVRNYVKAFDQSFEGLRGTIQEVAEAAKEFKVFYQKVPGTSDKTYTLDHTAGSYVLDRRGQVRLFIRPGSTQASMLEDVKKLILEKSS